MFCPRCSQEQISENTRFCSRCGFPLGPVAELLANVEFLPQQEDSSRKRMLPSRKTGIKIGAAWMLIILLAVVPFVIFTSPPEDSTLPGVLAFIGFVGGMLIMLLSWLFLEKENKPLRVPPNASFAPPLAAGAGAQTALPPQTSQPVEGYIPPVWKAPETKEFAEPGSVTEETTKFLKKEK